MSAHCSTSCGCDILVPPVCSRVQVIIMLGALAILIVEFAIISVGTVQGGGTVPVPCTCGIFLSGQFTRGSASQPESGPALLQEYDSPLPCTPLGTRQCANKCLEVIAKHLRNSASIICGSLDRDCFKERAYLWTKNCNDVWVNSNMSAGRDFCCKDGEPYKCPIGGRNRS